MLDISLLNVAACTQAGSVTMKLITGQQYGDGSFMKMK